MGRHTNNEESMEQVASQIALSLNDKPRHERSLENALLQNRTCLLVGPPGVGKTYTVNRIAQQHGWRVITLLALGRDLVYFRGLPMLEGNVTVYATPSWARKAASSETPVVLFFDMIDQAPPEVQWACSSIATARVVGDNFRLGESTRFVFAANPPEFGGHIEDSLASRVRHIAWEPSPAEMAQAIASATIEIARKRNFTIERANRASRYSGIISTFVTRHSQLVGPPKDPAARQEPWASPRSLTECAVALSRIPDNDKALRNNTIIHRIGVAAGSQLITFMENLDLPDPEDVLAGRSTINVDDPSDRVNASLTALVGAVAYRPTIDRWERCMTVLDTLAETSPDMVVPAFRRGIEIGKEPNNNLDKNAWMSVLENANLRNLTNVLRMAGAIK